MHVINSFVTNINALFTYALALENPISIKVSTTFAILNNDFCEIAEITNRPNRPGAGFTKLFNLLSSFYFVTNDIYHFTADVMFMELEFLLRCRCTPANCLSKSNKQETSVFF